MILELLAGTPAQAPSGFWAALWAQLVPILVAGISGIVTVAFAALTAWLRGIALRQAAAKAATDTEIESNGATGAEKLRIAERKLAEATRGNAALATTESMRRRLLEREVPAAEAAAQRASASLRAPNTSKS